MELGQILFLIAVGVFTLVAAATDLWTRRLPNWLTVPAFVAAVIYHCTLGQGPLFALGGFATGFGILLVLFLIGGGGGGDVKMMGALGAWLGAKLTLYVFFLSTLLAGLGCAVVLSVQLARLGYSQVQKRYFRRPAVAKTGEKQTQALQYRRVLPYALPVAVGTWLVLAWQQWLHQG